MRRGPSHRPKPTNSHVEELIPLSNGSNQGGDDGRTAGIPDPSTASRACGKERRTGTGGVRSVPGWHSGGSACMVDSTVSRDDVWVQSRSGGRDSVRKGKRRSWLRIGKRAG